MNLYEVIMKNGQHFYVSAMSAEEAAMIADENMKHTYSVSSGLAGPIR